MNNMTRVGEIDSSHLNIQVGKMRSSFSMITVGMISEGVITGSAVAARFITQTGQLAGFILVFAVDGYSILMVVAVIMDVLFLWWRW